MDDPTHFDNIAQGHGDVEAVVEAAWLYHEDGLTQAEIGRKLHVSRATAGRLLQSAKALGIVRIEFDTRYLSGLRTATELANRFGLQDAIVVPAQESDDRIEDSLAQAAEAYLGRFLRPGITVGIGWGQTVAKTLASLPDNSLPGTVFASAAGGIASITGALMSRTALAPHLKLLPAPVLMSSPELAQQLNREPSVRAVLDLAANADITLAGVGSASNNASSLRNSLVTAAELASYRAMGAVGDMVGEWYDINGKVLEQATTARKVGLKLKHFKKLPNVICVAGGADKTQAIRGAVAGGAVNVLVTDKRTANQLLAG